MSVYCEVYKEYVQLNVIRSVFSHLAMTFYKCMLQVFMYQTYCSGTPVQIIWLV